MIFYLKSLFGPKEQPQPRPKDLDTRSDWVTPTCFEDMRKTLLCPVCAKAWTLTMHPFILDSEFFCDQHQGYKVKMLLTESMEFAKEIAKNLLSQFPPCRPI